MAINLICASIFATALQVVVGADAVDQRHSKDRLLAGNVGSGGPPWPLPEPFVTEPYEKNRLVYMRAVSENGKPESKKPYRILMILDQPFPRISVLRTKQVPWLRRVLKSYY